MNICSMKTSAAVVAVIMMGWMMGCAPKPFKPDLTHTYNRIQPKAITVDGYQLVYTVTGNGPPIILLHGFGAQGWMWEYQQEALAKYFTVYTLDLLGHGYSDRPHIAYTPDLFIDSVKGFMTELEMTRATLIGNSLGAGVAMGIALNYPHLTDKLVLIGGFPQGVSEKAALMAYRVFLRFEPVFLLRIGFHLSGKGLLRSTLEKLVVDKSLITDDVIERAYKFRKLAGSAHALFSSRNNIRRWEEHYAPRIPEITTPTLVVWGTEDPLFPIPVGEELHQQIPNSKFRGIKGAGHLTMWEKPEETNAAILEFRLGKSK
ncbi:MAG TPA: alpha/beta hydrolase [Nitrospirales bacterium]|nr:alpha/beta hydrolase [Nitrospirales bacterium]